MWTRHLVQTWETRNAKYMHKVDGKSLQTHSVEAAVVDEA
jgi:hypothetical protein